MKIQNLTNKKIILDKKIVGGKCLPIHELSRKNIKVPISYAIGYDFYEDHLEKIGFWDKFSTKDFVLNKKILVKNIDSAKKYIQQSDLNLELEKQLKNILSKKERWAVRSSANIEDAKEKSWAGGFESYIGIKEKDVLDHIKKVWASVFSERVLNYLDSPEEIKNIKMSVLLQESIDADSSGVCFTQISEEDDDEMVIEAVHGIGELLVQGEVIPDRYTVNKEDMILLEVNFNEQPKKLAPSVSSGLKHVSNPKKKQQKITGSQIIELSKICLKVEDFYKSPRDIEWCVKDNTFYILQSRPITA